MTKVLHVRCPNAEPIGTFTIAPGETLGAVLQRLDCSARVEEIPNRPRKLDKRAADFIASYQREDPASVLAVFRRYGSLEAEEFDTVDEAVRFLESGEDYGSLSSEAVVDGERVICGDELGEMRWAVSDWNRSASPGH